MLHSISKKRTVIKAKAITIFTAIAASIALPQIFHWLGLVSGVGSSLGASFLPMHLPVILGGLIAGPLAGLIAGIVSPLLSYALSGMPSLTMLPFMMIELACYGLISGFLSIVKMPVILKLLSAQIVGRLVRALAVVFAVYGFNAKGITLEQAWNIVLIGLPGIVLQLTLIPLLMYRMKGLKKYYE